MRLKAPTASASCRTQPGINHRVEITGTYRPVDRSAAGDEDEPRSFWCIADSLSKRFGLFLVEFSLLTEHGKDVLGPMALVVSTVNTDLLASPEGA